MNKRMDEINSQHEPDNVKKEPKEYTDFVVLKKESVSDDENIVKKIEKLCESFQMQEGNFYNIHDKKFDIDELNMSHPVFDAKAAVKQEKGVCEESFQMQEGNFYNIHDKKFDIDELNMSHPVFDAKAAVKQEKGVCEESFQMQEGNFYNIHDKKFDIDELNMSHPVFDAKAAVKQEKGVCEAVDLDHNDIADKWKQDEDQSNPTRTKWLIRAKSEHKILTVIAKEQNQCQFCQKQFKYPCKLKAHLVTHTGVSPFTCKMCHKSLPSRAHLLSHMSIHVDDKTLSTDEFKSMLLAYKEKNKYYKSKNIYQCETCKKLFISQSSFLIHSRTHTGEKPFLCNMCDKSFSSNCFLKRHILTHYGVKPHKCKVCEKAFYDRKSLVQHMRTHTAVKPFLCNMCDKSFSNNVSLEHHILTHYDVKPHKCEVCEKAFYNRKSLVRHMKSHTGEKPFDQQTKKSC